jgi:NAD(P)H-hydrate epimerase
MLRCNVLAVRYTAAMQPQVLTREQVRRVDQIAIERYGMSSLVLMENAGRGVVDALIAADPSVNQTSPLAGPPRGPGLEGVALQLAGKCVAILCGKGNNAGDGFVIARHLHIRGAPVRVLLLAPRHELAGDARANADILAHTDVPLIELTGQNLSAQLDEHAASATWLIDAMLGTGATGEPREPFATAINWMNAQPARRLAVDLPSGLDCDTGQPAVATVRADVTCTFVALKPGFTQPQGRPFLGEVQVLSIGVPPRVVQEAAAV